jgi:sulfite reductase (NADPH) flavoprotein alpha-component
MPEVPVIPETAPFNPEQRLWLNGFLAGYFARMLYTSGAPIPAVPAKPAVPLLMMFGSQTGTAEGIAKRAAKEAEKRGFAPRVLPLNDFEQAALDQAERLIIISSTWGDGDPPDNATNFWSWVNSDKAPRLEQLQFAVLGLGDKNYSDFCGASKKFDARLEALGASRLIPRGECDVDYEAEAKSWLESLWQKLDEAMPQAKETASNGGATTAPPATNGHAQIATNGHAGPNGHAVPLKAGFGKSNPFPARMLRNICLNQPGSSKEVRHYELSLEGSGLAYEAGDALGVVPVNCPELVGDIIASLRCTGDEPVKVGEIEMPFREAIVRHLDIAKPSQELVAAVAARCPGAPLAPLLAPERAADLKQWIWGRGVIDLTSLMPEPFTPVEFVRLLRKLAPRLYSISSSPKAHPGEVHLTVGAVRYESHGRGRKGVASTFLADRVGDADFVKVFVQPSHGFRPPSDGARPMIMVGPGTGIAPFRAFLEERQAMAAKGRNWLFFGDQKRDTDFLYAEQLGNWQKEGHLARLDLAFSRDQAEKFYVQHRMLENAGELWAWLQEGGHFYVCGDASRMAKDVDAALHKVVETAGGKSPEEAKAYVATLKSEKRYQRDVY